MEARPTGKTKDILEGRAETPASECFFLYATLSNRDFPDEPRPSQSIASSDWLPKQFEPKAEPKSTQ